MEVIDYRIKTCSLVTYRGTLPYVVIVLAFVNKSYRLKKLDLELGHLQGYPYRSDYCFRLC